MNILTRKISIHAPPRGATDGRVGNLRLRISIHAPPRGATNVYWLRPPAEQFQFTPLREGRLCVRCCVPACRIFQFTPLREGRPLCPAQGIRHVTFQFTPLREGRRLVYAINNMGEHFNSRPSARGDACKSFGSSFTFSHFNSRPSARGDQDVIWLRRVR